MPEQIYSNCVNCNKIIAIDQYIICPYCSINQNTFRPMILTRRVISQTRLIKPIAIKKINYSNNVSSQIN